MTTGFKDDEIFLLSIEEYEEYKNVIPHINCWWWLRSPGYYSSTAAHVSSGGSVYSHGFSVYDDYGAVRPALRISNRESSDLKIGSRIVRYDFPWIVIDKDLAIAEVQIAFRRFDVVNNDYESSEIRRFLIDWIEERKR